jgi:hypothetical protein
MNAADKEKALLIWWRQRQLLQRGQLTIQRAALCFAQLQQLLLFTSSPALDQPRPYPTRTPRLHLNSLSDADCLIRFRFTLTEIERICTAMDLPALITVNRVRVSAVQGVAMLLRRLVWPARLVDLAVEFGLDVSSTGRIINHMAVMIVQLYHAHFDLWPGLDATRIAESAAAITAHTPEVIDIWGFIDGTSRRVARPIRDEHSSYSGYKRTHMQHYQGIVTPDGLIVSCMGPWIGTKNDLNMLAESKIQEILAPLVRQHGRTLMLYSDLIYKGQELVMCGYVSASTPERQRYNQFMSGLRVHVETAFGKVTQLFSGTDVKRVQRTGLSPTSTYYLCCVLFANVHTCMHSSNVPWNFNPPSVEEYLA